MLQGKGFPSNRAYLDHCSTVIAFKTSKYIRNIKNKKKVMQVNCNAVSIKKNLKGEYGLVEACYMPKGIANIFSMNEIEKLRRITYNSIDGYYVVHTDNGPVYFHKDEQGLPYIDLDVSVYDAATTLVQTVCSNY